MSEDESKPPCHCHHVVKIEVRMSVLWTMLGAVALIAVSLLINKLGERMTIRVNDAPSVAWPGERLPSLDPVPRPPVQEHRGQ